MENVLKIIGEGYAKFPSMNDRKDHGKCVENNRRGTNGVGLLESLLFSHNIFDHFQTSLIE